MQVVNIRGTTSSGKTTLVRQLIAASKNNDIVSLTKEVKCHVLDDQIIIGVYKKGSKFGGVDAIARIEYVEPAIMKALSLKSMVVFEGLLISHSYERWKTFSDKLKTLQKKHDAKVRGLIWIFTVPTFRENLNRLRKRNNIKGSVREAKGDQFILNFVQRYKSMQRILKKTLNSNETVFVLPHKEPFSNLQNLLYTMLINDPVTTLPIKKTGIRSLI